MAGLIRRMPIYHVIVISLLSIVLNNFLTSYVIVSLVSLTEFLKDPVYYIYIYGPILWSIYHIFLTVLVWYFIKREGGTLGEIIGSVGKNILSSIAAVLTLTAFSIAWFQVIESTVNNLIFGVEYMEQFFYSFRRIPFTMFLYLILVTSLTAGVCEEIIWRGYLQTRLQHLLGGRIYTATTIQAILFGLWHGPSTHAIFTAVFGYIYGLIYARTKILTPIMISHWLGDLLGFSILYYIAQ